MKKTLLSLFAMLLAGAGSALAQSDLDPNTIYAFYDDGTLTFRAGSTAMAYLNPINVNDNASKSPFSDDVKKGTTKVVFDKSCQSVKPTSTAYWFSGMYNLTSIEGMENLNTSEVTSMKDMFYDCSSLTTLDVSTLNTSNVTDMSEMFRFCSGLTSLDISKFDMKSVKDVDNFARSCSGLRELNLGGNDLSQYTNGWNYYSTESCLYGVGSGYSNVCHLTFTFPKKICNNRYSRTGYNFDGAPDQNYQLNEYYHNMIPAIYTYCGAHVVMADTIFCD